MNNIFNLDNPLLQIKKICDMIVCLSYLLCVCLLLQSILLAQLCIIQSLRLSDGEAIYHRFCSQ